MPIIPALIIIASLFIFALSIWIVLDNGIDKLKNKDEWNSPGAAGERKIYLDLIDKYNIPSEQILRNVYIPKKNGQTSEIDLLIISKKAIFVFECKNYAGNIYGDTKKDKWVQYLGKKKSYFYNPLLQNKSHVSALKIYLEEFGMLPVIPMVTTISRGKWNIRNLGPTDYFLGYNCHFKDILTNTPSSIKMEMFQERIIKKLAPLSRPDEEIKKKHIEQIKNRP